METITGAIYIIEIYILVYAIKNNGNTKLDTTTYCMHYIVVFFLIELSAVVYSRRSIMADIIVT